MWNGVLELKNDRAPVQMHFISGNRTLVPASLQDSGKPLHIGQRMRLEAAQLEQVLRRMMVSRTLLLLLMLLVSQFLFVILNRNPCLFFQ